MNLTFPLLYTEPQQLKLSPINDKGYYYTTKKTRCSLNISPYVTYMYSIKKKFKTNMRSGPGWLLDKHIPKTGSKELNFSWFIHDINYEGFISRENADNLLYLMLRKTELSEVTRQIVYVGLQIVGGLRYSKLTEKEKRNHEFITFNILKNAYMSSSKIKKKNFSQILSEGKFKTVKTLNTHNQLIFKKNTFEQVKSELIGMNKTILENDIAQFYDLT